MRFGRSTSSETDDHPSRPGRTSAGVRPGNDRTPACDSAWAASPAHRDSPGRRSRDHPVPPSPDLLPLYARRQRIAGMRVSVACQMDTTGQYLAVEESTYDLFAEVDRAPLLRIHYRRYQQSEPAAHIHVHGHRGALSHLLSQTGHESPHEMASLHVPVGGARFRPCLEDFIQFLVCECLLDAEAGWRAHVDAGRERWRLRQAAVVARDAPEVAARVLRGLGYTVEAPDPIPAAQAKALRNW